MMEIIEKATKALSAKVGEELSVAEYVRRRLMPLAFEDAGVKPKEFPPFVRGRQSPVGQYAAKLGVPRKELEKAWMDRMAEVALKKLEEEEPPSDRVIPRRSDVERLSPPGGIQIVKRRKQST